MVFGALQVCLSDEDHRELPQLKSQLAKDRNIAGTRSGSKK